MSASKFKKQDRCSDKRPKRHLWRDTDMPVIDGGHNAKVQKCSRCGKTRAI